MLLLDVPTWQVPWPGDLDIYFALQWLWHTYFASTFDISSTIRPTTIKPCKVLLLLTWQIPWPGDLDLYFGCSDFDIIYVNVPDLLKCKTSSHQTLHSASARCIDLAGVLTWWPWPIFCAPVPFTHFTSTFNISSTIRPTTIKPCVVLLLNVRTLQVPWLGDLTYISCSIDFYTFYITLPYVLNLRLSTTKPYIALLLDVLTRQVPWPGDLDLYCALQWLWHILCWCSVSPQILDLQPLNLA